MIILWLRAGKISCTNSKLTKIIFLDDDTVLDYSAKVVEVMRTLGLHNDFCVSTNGRNADTFIVVRTTLATDLWEA